jgi:hypothetical protein
MTHVVPQGTLTTHTLTPGKIYPGVTHAYQVYVPAQYDPTRPAPCMVFLDGVWVYAAQMRAVEILHQAIAAGDIPPLIGIFVDPGWYPVADPETQQARMNRHVEYDALTPTFARFLTEELLPEVAQKYPLSTDPNDRGIVGLSSGAIGSFIAAWHPPHPFRRMYIMHRHLRRYAGRALPADLGPQDRAAPHPHLPAGNNRRQRSPVGQLAAGQRADGGSARLLPLRRPVRGRPRDS